MNKYEITIITLKPFDVAQGKATKENPPAGGAPVKKEIENLGGKILSVSSIGQRQFVFPIKKETAGYYTVINFEIEPTKVLDLNNKLILEPEVLRHIILTAKAVKIEAPRVKKMPEKEKVPEKIEAPEAPKIAEEPVEKPAKVESPPAGKEIETVEAKEKPVKKTVKKPEVVPVTEAAKEIEAEELSADERLKALDKKLDELLKE